MVKSEQVLVPQVYLEKVLGKFYFLKDYNNPPNEIQCILKKNGVDARDYPLSEIDRIVEKEIDVVLVDCSHYEGTTFISEFRWFEVPEGVTI